MAPGSLIYVLPPPTRMYTLYTLPSLKLIAILVPLPTTRRILIVFPILVLDVCRNIFFVHFKCFVCFGLLDGSVKWRRNWLFRGKGFCSDFIIARKSERVLVAVGLSMPLIG